MPAVPKTRPGSPAPLGATWDGEGTNFALYSEGATGVELCLVDRDRQELRIPMRQRTESVWHVYVEGVGPGQLYAYRVDGPWDPQQGFRFNKKTRLLDPWAKAVSGVEDWDAGAFSSTSVRATSFAMNRTSGPRRSASWSTPGSTRKATRRRR